MKGAMSAIGPKQTSLIARHLSAFGGKADTAYCGANVCFFDPKRIYWTTRPTRLPPVLGSLSHAKSPTYVHGISSRMTVSATGGDAIRPFRINSPDAELAGLRRRINATK